MALSSDEGDFKSAIEKYTGTTVAPEELQKYRALVTSNSQSSIDAIKKIYGRQMLFGASTLTDETKQGDKIIKLLGNILTSVGAIGTVADLENALGEWKSFAEKATNKQLSSADIA